MKKILDHANELLEMSKINAIKIFYCDFYKLEILLYDLPKIPSNIDEIYRLNCKIEMQNEI